MKILQIAYDLRSGGAERFVVDLSNELAKDSSNEVYLMATNDDSVPGRDHYRKCISDRVKYFSAGAKSGFTIKSILLIYKYIKEINPDIVHIHTHLIPLYLQTFFIRKYLYLHTIHNVAEKEISITSFRPLQRFLYKKFVQAVTISGICHNSYKDFYNLDNDILITNGRSPIQTTELLKMVESEIESYKKASDTKVFVHIARYNKQKNQELLINTFMRLKEEGENFLLLIIGDGYQESPIMAYAKEEEIKILGAKKNVGDYLACSDYFILSSKWEGLPLSLLEAMSMGCIPISTPAGGVANIIKDGINGYISPSFEEEDFYKMVKGVLTKEETISAETIKEEYRKKYTMEICAEKYYTLYQQMLSKKNRYRN